MKFKFLSDLKEPNRDINFVAIIMSLHKNLYSSFVFKPGITLLFLIISVVFIGSCAANSKNVQEADKNTSYIVKVVNSSIDKVLLRYQNDELSYTFRFVDSQNSIKFRMSGNLIVQYSLQDYDNAKIIKIKQDTLIHVKQNDIIIDDLPAEDKTESEKKSP